MNLRNFPETFQAPALTDSELVEQSKRGDHLAMTELIRRHYGASLRVARSILRNQPDSEDVVQDAYGRAFRHLHTFREEARFSTWITSIVVNQSRMHLRRQRRAILLGLDEPAPRYLISGEPTPEESASRRETSLAISRALARLPIELRMPYKLHAISGLPVMEVADRLGISISATKSRIFRARCTLESRLNVSYGTLARHKSRVCA